MLDLHGCPSKGASSFVKRIAESVSKHESLSEEPGKKLYCDLVSLLRCTMGAVCQTHLAGMCNAAFPGLGASHADPDPVAEEGDEEEEDDDEDALGEGEGGGNVRVDGGGERGEGDV